MQSFMIPVVEISKSLTRQQQQVQTKLNKQCLIPHTQPGSIVGNNVRNQLITRKARS